MPKTKTGFSALGIAALLTSFLASADAATIRIASISPLSGSLTPIGTEVRRGAQLAVQQYVKVFKTLGHDLELVPLDDQASATYAPQVARKVLDDPSILGVVGALNSSVSNVLAATFAPANLAIISPASTNTALTENGWRNFSRLVAPDIAQGVAAAKYLSEEIGAKKVVVVSDNTAYGNSLSKSVQSNLKKANVTISAYLGASNDQQIASAIKVIKASQPNAVYYGGTDDNGSKLVKAMRAAGIKAVFMGGDGLDSPSFTERAGKAAAGVVYSSGFGPIDPVTGRNYLRLYEATFKEQPNGVSAYSYDATVTLLQAIQSTLTGGSVPTRADVSAAVRRVNIEACRAEGICTTVSGPVAFDANGERQRSKVYIVTLDSKLQPEITTVKTVTADSLR